MFQNTNQAKNIPSYPMTFHRYSHDLVGDMNVHLNADELGNRHPVDLAEKTTWAIKKSSIHEAWLVVLTILKHMKVNGKDYPIHYGK